MTSYESNQVLIRQSGAGMLLWFVGAFNPFHTELCHVILTCAEHAIADVCKLHSTATLPLSCVFLLTLYYLCVYVCVCVIPMHRSAHSCKR
jgi:hypothetical protein